MKKQVVLALLLVGVIAIPVGLTLADQQQEQRSDVFLQQAAEDMGLEVEEAREILEQARELRIRSRAHRQGISYEEALEMMEQRREEIRERMELKGNGMRFRNPDRCGNCPYDEE